MTGTGHNRGSQPTGSGWRAHCRPHARRRTLAGSLPIKAGRPPVRHARSLRLECKTCAGIRARAGRDLRALLAASQTPGALRDGQAPAAQVLAAQVLARAAPRDVLARPIAPFGTSWARLRDNKMKGWLRVQGQPADAVPMTGTTAHEREMMMAGGLAGCVSAQAFLAGVSDAL